MPEMTTEQQRQADAEMDREQALAEELYDEMDDRALEEGLNIFGVAVALWVCLTHLLIEGGWQSSDAMDADDSGGNAELSALFTQLNGNPPCQG